MKQILFVGIIILLLIFQSFCGLSTAENQDEENLEAINLGSRSTNGYRNYTETVQIMKNLETLYPGIVKMYDLGKRYPYFNGTAKTTRFNNSIWALRISDNPNLDEDSEPAILYTGLHHAREWITVEVCLYMMQHLSKYYNSNATIKDMVNSNEIWIVPIVNPDGFIYSHEQDDINKSSGSGGWRKNMQETNGVPGFQTNSADTGDGVDLNRNYGYKWGYDNIGSESDPNGTTYRGPSPFSEPETQLIRDLALDRQFDTAVSMHSHGEIIIFPWGYKDADTPHHEIFLEMSKEMARHNNYQYGNPNSGIIYNVNGEFADYLYGTMETLSFTFELGTNFIPPSNLVQGISKSNAEAAFVAAKYASNPLALFESGIEGTVKDTKGNPLEGVQVNTNFLNYSISTKSDKDGKYVLKAPKGLFNITFEKNGFDPVNKIDISVPSGNRITLNIIMKDNIPPSILEVKAATELLGDENNSVFNAGEQVVIIVRDKDNETDLNGYVFINSSKQNYVSPNMDLTYSFGLSGYYAYWDTEGFNQSDDYYIDAVLTDYDGNIDLDGSVENGPDLIISLLDVTSPVISSVKSSVGADFGGVYETGSIVRLEITEASGEKYLDGTVQIIESELGYSSGVKGLEFDSKLNYYYWDWDTTGLKPSAGYQVETTLTDKWGNSDSDGLPSLPDLKIGLIDTTAPVILAMDSFVNQDRDENYDLGDVVTFMVYEASNESGLSGYVKLYSPDLKSEPPLQLDLTFDSENNFYYTRWVTSNATPFIDYYIDSFLTDDYSNADPDGSVNFGPDLVVVLNDFQPPQIKEVYSVNNAAFNTGSGPGSQYEPDKMTVFEVGDEIRIIVEPVLFEPDLSGFINITSNSALNAPIILNLLFDEDFDHYYAVWNSGGFDQSDDYSVESVLSDPYGNSDMDGLYSDKPDLILSLKDTRPPAVDGIKVAYPEDLEKHIERIELGRNVRIDIAVLDKEIDLNGLIQISSVSNNYDSKDMKASYNSTTGTYVLFWNTEGMRTGIDYVLEAKFSDKYGNIDTDGLKEGPDLLLGLEDTILPMSIINLKIKEEINQKGVVNLTWSVVEENTTVLIYRSEIDSSSIANATLIVSLPSKANSYTDKVSPDGRTYYYMVFVSDENGNINYSITFDNSGSVTVSRTDQEQLKSGNRDTILIGIVVIILIILILLFLIRKRKPAPEKDLSENQNIDDGKSLVKSQELPADESDTKISAEELYKNDY